MRMMRSVLSEVGRIQPPQVQSPTQSSSAPLVPQVASVQDRMSVAASQSALAVPSTKFVVSLATVPALVRSQSVPQVVPEAFARVLLDASSMRHSAIMLPR